MLVNGILTLVQDDIFSELRDFNCMSWCWSISKFSLYETIDLSELFPLMMDGMSTGMLGKFQNTDTDYSPKRFMISISTVSVKHLSWK